MPADRVDTPADSTLSQEREPQEVVVKREPEKDLVVWNAAARPFKRRDKQFFVTAFAISGIIGLILFFAEGFMPVLLIIALVFLYYVLSTVEPENIEYKVSNRGIKIANTLTEWRFLTRFWFSKRFDNEIVIFETVLIPGRIEMVIEPGVKDRLKKEVSAYLLYEEASPSTLDRLTDWLSKKMPGNK